MRASLHSMLRSTDSLFCGKMHSEALELTCISTFHFPEALENQGNSALPHQKTSALTIKRPDDGEVGPYIFNLEVNHLQPSRHRAIVLSFV